MEAVSKTEVIEAYTSFLATLGEFEPTLSGFGNKERLHRILKAASEAAKDHMSAPDGDIALGAGIILTFWYFSQPLHTVFNTEVLSQIFAEMLIADGNLSPEHASLAKSLAGIGGVELLTSMANAIGV